MKAHNFKKLITTLCGALIVIALVQPNSAYQTFQSPAGVPYKWNLEAIPDGTIYWSIDPIAPAIVRESMLYCSQKWEKATDGKLKFSEGPNAMIRVDWDTSGAKIPDSLFLGYAYFKSSDQQTISSAIVVINAKNYTWHRGGYTGVGATVNGMRDANLDSVLLHEIGHTLGMDHSDRNVANIVGPVTAGDLPTMNSVIYPGAESLHMDDETGVRNLYLGDSEETGSPIKIVATPTKGRAPLTVTFAQIGGDGTSLWNFGDGVSIKGGATIRRFTVPGIYNVEVVCNGKKGSVTIEVESKNSAKSKIAKKKVRKAS